MEVACTMRALLIIRGGTISAERVPQTPRKNASGRREEPCSGVEAIPIVAQTPMIIESREGVGLI
jgi:hypothetical protein